jgi:hypothetical protein
MMAVIDWLNQARKEDRRKPPDKARWVDMEGGSEALEGCGRGRGP